MAGRHTFDWSGVKEKIKAGEKKTYEKDARFWKPTVDEKGNASAVIRFIPNSDMTPFTQVYTHNFNYMQDGVKKYWIRNCVNTFGYDRECPICKKNMEYWNSAFESDKKIASDRKRKLEYISNILVIKNPANPEDEGKIFLFKYGKKIFDKINEKMSPTAEMKALGKKEFVPFDFYEGANFLLVQTKQGDYPNFDKSEFADSKPLGTDAQIDLVMSKAYSLEEFTAPDKFPTNEEVIQKLGFLLGISSTTGTGEASTAGTTAAGIEDTTSPSITDFSDDIPDHALPADLAEKAAAAKAAKEALAEPATTDTVDDDADFFKNLR